MKESLIHNLVVLLLQIVGEEAYCILQRKATRRLHVHQHTGACFYRAINTMMKPPTMKPHRSAIPFPRVSQSEEIHINVGAALGGHAPQGDLQEEDASCTRVPAIVQRQITPSLTFSCDTPKILGPLLGRPRRGNARYWISSMSQCAPAPAPASQGRCRRAFPYHIASRECKATRLAPFMQTQACT